MGRRYNSKLILESAFAATVLESNMPHLECIDLNVRQHGDNGSIPSPTVGTQDCVMRSAATDKKQ